MKAVKINLAGRERHLCFTVEAMFQIEERFGGAQELTDTMEANSRIGFEAVCGAAAILAEQGELLRLLMAQGHSMTVTLTCDRLEGDEGSIFSPARRTAGALLRLAQGEKIPCEVEYLVTGERGKEEPLVHLEGALFSDERPAPALCGGAVELFQAASPRSEVEWTAARILQLVREENLRFRDIGVAARSYGTYRDLVESVFRRYGVPVFSSAMTDILEKPVLALVTAALDTTAGGYRYDDIFRYLKTGLTELSQEDVDLLENYVLKWDIKGSRWTQAKDWSWHPKGYGLKFSQEDRELLARVDGARRQVTAPLEALRKNPDKTGRGRALALYQFLEDIDLPTRLAQRADSLDRRGDRPGLLEFYDRRAVEVDQLAYRGMKKLRRRRRVDRKSFAEARKLLWQAFERFRKVCEDEGLETPEDYDRRYKMHYLCAKWLEELLSLLDEGEQYEAVKAVLSAQKE